MKFLILLISTHFTTSLYSKKTCVYEDGPRIVEVDCKDYKPSDLEKLEPIAQACVIKSGSNNRKIKIDCGDLKAYKINKVPFTVDGEVKYLEEVTDLAEGVTCPDIPIDVKKDGSKKYGKKELRKFKREMRAIRRYVKSKDFIKQHGPLFDMKKMDIKSYQKNFNDSRLSLPSSMAINIGLEKTKFVYCLYDESNNVINRLLVFDDGKNDSKDENTNTPKTIDQN